jgi:hypothetical protein
LAGEIALSLSNVSAAGRATGRPKSCIVSNDNARIAPELVMIAVPLAGGMGNRCRMAVASNSSSMVSTSTTASFSTAVFMTA